MSAGLDEDAHTGGGDHLARPAYPDSGERVFGPPRLRQDMSALPALVDLGVAEFDALVKAGRIDPDTEHVLCHYSAEHFRDKLLARLREAGYSPDDERWFTNLHTAGNTGAASIFVMLEAARTRLRRGDRVLLIVPESGRFTLAFAQLTCVGPERRREPGRAVGLPAWPPVPATPRPGARLHRARPGVGRVRSGDWPGCRSCAGSRTARRPSRTTAGSCSTCASRSSTAAGGSRSPPRTSRPTFLAAQRRDPARRGRAPRLPVART